MRDPLTDTGSDGRPDVFAAMRRDHRSVLDRLEAIETSVARIASRPAPAGDDEDDGRLRAFVAHLEAQFATHMRAEDEVVYPTLAAELPDTRSVLVPLRVEHSELRAMLASLRATLDEPAGASRDEQVVVQCGDLADLLRIHIRKEEAIVFTAAERLLPADALTALAGRLARPSVPHATLIVHPPSHTKEG